MGARERKRERERAWEREGYQNGTIRESSGQQSYSWLTALQLWRLGLNWPGVCLEHLEKETCLMEGNYLLQRGKKGIWLEKRQKVGDGWFFGC